jgi:hypothetical protein
MMPLQSPRRHGHLADLLPAYVNGTLAARDARRVSQHLSNCAACRATLAAWEVVGGAVQTASEPAILPSLALMDRVWAQIDGQERTPAATLTTPWQRLTSLAQLTRRQAPLLPAGIWAVSAAALASGFLIVLLMHSAAHVATVSLLGMIVPLVTAVGIAFIYGPENDAGLELALATPTSPRLVLLSRLALVFGYNCILALGLTLLLATLRGGDFVLLASLWIGPTLLLAGVSLLLSSAVSTVVGAVGAAGLLCLRLITAAPALLAGGSGPTTWPASALWQTNPLVLVLAAVLLVAAVVSVPRRERLA